MPVSKEQITWIASRLAHAERMNSFKTRMHKIEFISRYCLYCGNGYIDFIQAEAILKYINR